MGHIPQTRPLQQRWILPLSSAGGSGKTTQVANLALALRLRGMRVLMIDADFANGSLGIFFKVPSGEIEPFVTLADEFKKPLPQYPADAVRRRIYPHPSGVDLLLSGRGLMEVADMNDHSMACMLATVHTLPYDVVLMDAGPDLKARPTALRELARGGYGVVIAQPGRKERSGAIDVLHVLASMTRPDTNDSLLRQIALLGVAAEHGSCARIEPVYHDLLQRFDVYGLGIIPRDAALISTAAESNEFVSVFNLSPRSAYCRAMLRACDLLLPWIQAPASAATPAPHGQQRWWQRLLPRSATPRWEGGTVP